MITVDSFAEVRAAAAGTVGLVPTMGFLHEGHLSLIHAARAESDTVVMSLYVNPAQFNQPADLERYPRDAERDAALAKRAGVDVLFAPPDDEMYPTAPMTSVVLPDVTASMEGRHRPGHLDGVAIAVAKLFAGCQPDLAYFGRKDAQQLAMVRAMTTDLGFPVGVRGMPLIREQDGLALSSRNVFLSAAERTASLSIFRGLGDAAERALAGEREGSVLEEAAHVAMAAEPGVEPDYAMLASQATAQRLDRLDQPAFLAVAAAVEETRLIDNVHFDFEAGSVVPDLGVRLDHPSDLYDTARLQEG